MVTRLNGWQRIGGVVTALWLAYVVVLGLVSAYGTGPFSVNLKATYKSLRVEQVCSKPAPSTLPSQSSPAANPRVLPYDAVAPLDGCRGGSTLIRPATEETVQVTPPRHIYLSGFFLLALLIPPALFWALSYGTIAVYKWVAKGFRRGAT